MAKYEVREGQTNIFRNDYKKDEKHPDYKAQVLVDGKLRDIALWERTANNGAVYYGCKITDGKPREEKQVAAKPEFSDRPLAQTLNDEIPFAPEWR